MSTGVPDHFYREAQRLRYVARSAFKLLQIQKQHQIIKPGASVLDLGCAPGAWLQVACQSLGPVEKGGIILGVDMKKVKVPSDHCDERVQTMCADVLKINPHLLMGRSPMVISCTLFRALFSYAGSQEQVVSPYAITFSAGIHKTEDANIFPGSSNIQLFPDWNGKGFSVILSDMCPAVSGVGSRDAALSGELGMRTLYLALGNRISSPEMDDQVHMETLHDVTGQSVQGLLLSGGSLVIKLLEGEESQGFPKLCKGSFKLVSWLRPKATRSSSREIYFIAKGCK